MTRKKILLVIVEGPSDETALGYALSQVYDREDFPEKILPVVGPADYDMNRLFLCRK